MQNQIRIVAFEPQNIKLVADLFYRSVHNIDTKFYSKKQKDAWASWPIDYQFWQTRLTETSKQVWCAWQQTVLVGFIELNDKKSIDCTYVHPHYQSQGIASKLYQHLEQQAKINECKALDVYASRVARPIFKHWGFMEVETCQHKRGDETLENYKMVKKLVLE
jgi:putative acetyltransferase